MVSLLLHVFIRCYLVSTLLWRKLHPVPAAMLTVTKISIQDPFSIYLTHTVFIGNQSPWFWCIIIESVIFLWCGSVGHVLQVSEDRAVSRRGDEKSTYTFPHYGGQPAKNLLILPIWKKTDLPAWKNFPVSWLPPPVPPNTKFLFPQASKPKPLN